MERSQVRCAIYTRQSVVRPETTDFTSCDAQYDACLSYVRAYRMRGWVPVAERFDDAGATGSSIAFGKETSIALLFIGSTD